MTKDIESSNARSIKIEPDYLIQTRMIGKSIKVQPLLINGQICDCLLHYLSKKNILLDYKPVSKKVFDQMIEHSPCKCKEFLRKKENRKTVCLCKKPNFYDLSKEIILEEGEECFSFSGDKKDCEKSSVEKTPKIEESDNRIYLYFPRGKNIKESFFYCPCMSGEDLKKIERKIKHNSENKVGRKQRSVEDEVDELISAEVSSSNVKDKEKTKKPSTDHEEMSSEVLQSQSVTTEESKSLSAETDSSRTNSTVSSGICECDSHENVLSENVASGSHTEISTPTENTETNSMKKEDEGIHEVLENYEANPKPLEKEKGAKIKSISTVGKENLNENTEIKKPKKEEAANVNKPYGSDPSIGLSKQSNLSVTEEVDINELDMNLHDSREPLFPSTIEIIPVKRNTFLHKLRESNLVLAEGWLWKKRYFFSCLYHKRYFVLTKDAELIYFRDPYCVTGEATEEQNQTEDYETTLIYPNTIPFNYNRLFDPSLAGNSGEVMNRTRDIPVINKYMCISNPKFLSLTDSMEIYRATCLTEAHPYKLVLKHSSYNDQLLFDTQSERDLWAARVTYIKKKYSDTRKRYIQSSVPTGRLSSNTTTHTHTNNTRNMNNEE